MNTNINTLFPKKVEIIILYGCSIKDEIESRIDLAVKIYNDIVYKGSYCFLIYSNEKADYFKTYLNNRIDPYFVIIDEDAKDTIDNIINTFSIIYNFKNPLTIKSNHDGNIIEEPINNIYKIHHISSAYHLRRIKLILLTLKYYNENMEFYGSLQYDCKRYETEYLIEKNSQNYLNKILQKYNEKYN